MNSLHFDAFKILIADDNKNMRMLLRVIVHNFGVRAIQEAENGQQAFQLFQADPPDLVLADIKMHPVDGFNFLKMIRNPDVSRDPYVPVIIVTGHAEKELVKQARDWGAHEFMVKPITADALKKRIIYIMEQPRPFIHASSFFGPDRRRANKPFDGLERRDQL
jgi:CheY-like chemotaxis protein